MFIVTDNQEIKYGLFESKRTALEEIKKQVATKGFDVADLREFFLDRYTIWLSYGLDSHYFYITLYNPQL